MSELKYLRSTLENAVRNKQGYQFQADRSMMMQNMSKELMAYIQPFMSQMMKANERMKHDMVNAIAEALSKVKISTPEANVRVTMPKIEMPEIRVPTPQVTMNPTFNVPKQDFDLSKVIMPNGEVELRGVDRRNPLPVCFYGPDGKLMDMFGGGSNAPRVVDLKGSPTHATAGDGTRTITTAGTRVQLSTTSVPCRRVVIYNRDDNGALASGGLIVVGGPSVVASQSTRRGAAIFPANGMEFFVNNLNLLYLDSTDSGAVAHYYYEA